ncbi:hypothetical protein ACFLT2_02175 [Acidobacteriota bacterium]
MNKRIFILLCSFVLCALSFQAWPQFKSEELAERPKWEEFLKVAEITGHSNIPDGVTKPIKLTLKKGEMECNGCWKNPKGMKGGFLEGWQYEIAAYELDKLIGLNMIPPTVEREFKGKKGSLQYWVTFKTRALEMQEQGIKIPRERLDRWIKQKYLARAYDCLIANEDRNQQDIGYTDDWRTILLDHSRSFRYSKKFRKQLVLGKNGLIEKKLFRTLPRAFVEKINALDFNQIKEAVGPYLTKEEIEAILDRKELLLAEIQEMIREKGEENVLY